MPFPPTCKHAACRDISFSISLHFFFFTVFFEWVFVMCWHVHILSNWIVCSRMPSQFFYIFLFRWQQLLINSIVGYDTILTNSLVNSPGHGTHLILLCIHNSKVTVDLLGSMSNNCFLHFVWLFALRSIYELMFWSLVCCAGYLYNFQTKELYDLSYGHEPPEGPTRFGGCY
jgi:hypothetical protein